MTDKRTIATYVLSTSLFCLAGAIFYFTFELAQIARQIPDILTSVEKTSEKIEPVVKETNKIRELISPVVTEVSEIRKQIPDILEEVRQTRKLVPHVLEEVKHTRALVPPLLEEVKKTREAIPAMLSKADKIVTDAKKIGQKTSEGAVTGVITGIFKAPFKLVGGIGKTIFGTADPEKHGITEKDQEILNTKALDLLVNGKVGDTREWSNPESGNIGTFTLKEIKSIDGKECKTIQNIVRKNNKAIINQEFTACRINDTEWERFDG